MSSTPEVSSLPRGEDNQPLPIFSGSASINDSNPTPSATQTVGVANEGDDTDTHFQKKKRVKKSAVWLEFTEETINGELKARCNHCKSVLKVHKSGSTTHFNRHLEACIHRKKNQIQLQQ
ncbi:hypothetical protein Tsubulata_042401 [Turnera subulata]|uniref:BED-type domain-containing protein n=1 Tax=Turnera subulata TaxID=218843 RepID=A0A9Q0FA21_9ROSI|nr:hypothetical protein Tsubulata_042401 [Turnera subulata]